MLRIFLPLLALGAAVQPLAAQALPDSIRVRITAPQVSPNRPLIGTLDRADEWGIALREERGGAVTNIPGSVIVLAEVSRGQISSREGAVRGMRTGALVGSVLGAGGALLYSLNRNIGLDDDSPRRRNLLEESAKGLAIGGVPGVLLGWVLGGNSSERWERVPLPELMMNRKDRAVSVSVRFTR